MIACILHPSCFCEIWALCVSWITYDHLYYAPYFACWALFGSLVPAMCIHTSCAQVHELPQSHCGDNWKGTLFSWLHLHYAYLASVRFEHSVCCGSLMATCNIVTRRFNKIYLKLFILLLIVACYLYIAIFRQYQILWKTINSCNTIYWKMF